MVTTIKDVGEIELLNRLKKFMRSGQIDDDVAEITSYKKQLLINNDLLVVFISATSSSICPNRINLFRRFSNSISPKSFIVVLTLFVI